ncbi:7-cyano-7-deazaguanine synthase [Sinirhodobacter sp. HNIBRBA609]|nr:7-cyano-7-deazaguanine synthase [Sinirhodobacter sp. HNIBRBA609]
MRKALIEDLDGGITIPVRVNGASPTFQLETNRIAASALAPLDTAIDDLLHVASVVFLADGSISRGGDTRSNMGANWRRNLRLTIEVTNPLLWSDSTVVAALEDAVGFLTEDRVQFRFEQSSFAPPPQGFLDLDPNGARFEAEEVVLFSGGLDSFAGALEALSTRNDKLLLVSHRSAQKVLPRQDRLAEYLENRFPGRHRHIKVTARRAGPQATETTQRSRSLLFAALGQAVAKSFGASRINFYENGIVSHNLPISPQVVGTMATRTTHPLGIQKLNRLIDLVVPNAVRIGNPYAWMTKTEVVQRIAQHGGEGQISQAVSCTSVRDQTILHTHCGTCSQCLDRRFGILAANLEQHDPPDHYKTDVLLGARDSENSIKMGVEWTRHALHLNQMSLEDFFSRFALEATRIAQGYPELALPQALERIHAMHQRHANAVASVLQKVIQENSAHLAEARLPPTCLLRLHLGPEAHTLEPRLPSTIVRTRISLDRPDKIEPEDTRPDPLAPLKVAFFKEGRRSVVAVIGMTRIEGPPAIVPHALKPAFDQDRSNGLAPDEHRYVNILREPGGPEISKDNLRKLTQRCRDTLAQSYEQLFGHPPPDHLLIQSQPRQGYRLDPSIQLTNRPD